MDKAERAPVRRMKLTAEMEDKYQTVLVYAVYHQPFFSHLLMSELPVIFTEDVPIAGTDSISIFINPTQFFEKPLSQQAFILFHEVLHVVFGDLLLMNVWKRLNEVEYIDGVKLPYFHMAMNAAADFVINAALIEAKAGEFPREGCFDPSLCARGMEASADVYRKLWDQNERQIRMGRYDTGKRGFDMHMEPGAADGGDPAKAAQEAQDDVRRKAAIAAAAEIADAQGKLPAGLKRLIGEVLDPKVAWQEQIRSELNRCTGTDGLDWATPDRRMISRHMAGPYKPIFFGAQTGFSCGPLAIGIDTSGSIQDPQLDRFFSEMVAIVSDLNPSELHLFWCDANVHDEHLVEEVEDLDVIRANGVNGGGGTRFEPVFERIKELHLEIDALVYFTDLMGSFPKEEPSYPVVWASISGKSAPFGKTIHVEV